MCVFIYYGFNLAMVPKKFKKIIAEIKYQPIPFWKIDRIIYKNRLNVIAGSPQKLNVIYIIVDYKY